MGALLFNSRDKRYKDRFGAVQSGEAITFRLLLPFDSGAVSYGARLVVTSDFTNETQYYELCGTDRYENGNRWWEVYYTAGEPGIYWYHFEYDGPWSSECIYKGPYSSGIVTNRATSWQLTVYKKGYRTPDLLKGGVMYQIFPDRFFGTGRPKHNVPEDRDIVPWNSVPRWRPDAEGKVRNNDYFGGDLKGIEQKLPYIRNLGANIIYLNPIFESHTNHRYSTADYTKIDPLLGTEKDFVSLCEHAHRLGMYIILDGVFNHTGDDSIYFNKYNRYPDVGAYNSKKSPYYRWYHFSKWPDQYDSWWGFDILPDVDETNPDYVEYITGENGVIAKWLRLGADGWRLDVADELPDDFIAKIHARAKAVNPNAIVLGEVWENASNKVAYSVRRHYLLGNELDSVMNYPFANAVIDFVANGDAETFLEQIEDVTETYPKPIQDVLMNLLGTHDTERVLTRLAGEPVGWHDREWQASRTLTADQYVFGVRLEKIAAAIQFTLPGFPSIYYGDEAGMQGYKDPFNRRGFPWGRIDTSLSSWYSWLGLLRRTCPVLEHGQFVPISGAEGCVAYARMDVEHPDLDHSNDALVIIANRNPNGIDYLLPPELDNCQALMNVIALNERKVTIGPYTCAILGRGKWAD